VPRVWMLSSCGIERRSLFAAASYPLLLFRDCFYTSVVRFVRETPRSVRQSVSYDTTVILRATRANDDYAYRGPETSYTRTDAYSCDAWRTSSYNAQKVGFSASNASRNATVYVRNYRVTDIADENEYRTACIKSEYLNFRNRGPTD